MLALVAAHLVVAGLLPLVSRRSRRAAFGVAAVLPAATLVWGLANAGAALSGGVAETTAWSPALGLTLSFRLDALALAMIVLVSGIGAVILVYCVGYFGRDSPEAPRSAALLLAFAGAMLGLVLADDLLTLYLFWELTSIASFLLVGQGGERREERRAAVQALLVTVFGGLAMLLGFVLLGEAAGTYRISEILADPPRGALVVPALLLILLGAFTKSAQLPFHPWLPAAMVAPTPVSAYLHAASMVKAGVYLVGRLSPAFADLAVWTVPILVAGIATMLIGGWRALSATDLKRLLAFGTVSQLGFLMVLFGAGGRVAAMAGIAMLLAHGLFKATLFLTVGAVDHATGTRDVRELSGVGRALPGLAVAAALAAASMAGLPPLIGFVGKEAAFEAFLHGTVQNYAVAAGLLLGSVLTVAYSARFLWGAFARKPGREDTPVHRLGATLTVPVWLCAVAGPVLGIATPIVDAEAAGYAAAYPGEAGYHLALWHGLGLPLLFSAIAVAGGLALHAARARTSALAGHSPLDAQRAYEKTIAGIGRLGVVITGRLQVGSLPSYLATIIVAFILLPGAATVMSGAWPTLPPLYHAAIQVPLALVVVVAAVAVTRTRRRFTAVLLVGVIGYGVGGLFIVDGAPDLALAQFLVETLSLVAFVFVMRRLPAQFTERRPTRRVRVPKMLLGTVGGVAVAVFAIVLSGARSEPSAVSGEFARLAPEAGAYNVVNAIIVDFRALDTVGEIGVLFVAAAGVASLVHATRYDRRVRGAVESGQASPRHEEDALG
ncbi:hydrogen gas-evolving membrane-bound hydrogenase subunit E [Pseudonocardia sp. MH-G8]|uniref:hydrogen gas-evolving membrane-bound hydrogenase subunit E n=1 Tax=Pseudonocardia sp. MH-G8 TaxID=1854588 RepID=UPI000BA1853A|nr:hydrogen gas-evolving membrane-bound hydrogenase subunit E [Pseudonocardia sp. MH-G8]OZM78441.1 NADH ubiquinone oxidoreductase subunit NDUFA12 [Pseudonocardia sp. MH-G8]